MKRSESIKTYNRPAPAEGLPESPELERAVLGALILEPDQLPDVAEIVEISAFVDAKTAKSTARCSRCWSEAIKSTSIRFRNGQN